MTKLQKQKYVWPDSKWDCFLVRGWTDGKSGRGSKKLRARKKNRNHYYKGCFNQTRPCSVRARRERPDHKGMGRTRGFRCRRSPLNGRFYPRWVRMRWVYYGGWQAATLSFDPGRIEGVLRVDA